MAKTAPEHGHQIYLEGESRWIDEPDAYVRKRIPEYPEVTDVIDALMKWLATETEFEIPKELKSLAMQCMSVKSRHPKKGK